MPIPKCITFKVTKLIMASGSLKFFQAVRKLSSKGRVVALPAQVFGIEGRYAHALYSAAVKGGQLKIVGEEVSKLQGLLESDRPFREYLKDPTHKKTEKKAVLSEALTKQHFSNLTVNLFALMAENGRLKKTPAVLNSFNAIMRAHRGEVFCVVTTAKPLSSAQETKLNSTLELFLQPGQSLKLDKKIDSSLIGGMIVNLGDRYVDMSTATKIKTYSNIIKHAF